MFKWIKERLTGIFNIFGFFHKKANVVLIGLDNAGKTTLLRRLKDDKYTQEKPTIIPHMEELTMGKLKFQTFDLGGHENARKLWRNYCTTAHALIYVVDAAARSRFDSAREELHLVMDMPEISNVPIAVLGNKIDKKGAASEDELRSSLGLPHEFTWGKDAKKVDTGRPIEIFMCSIAKRMGYVEAFQWISTFIN
eukprot:TRINITY_DN419_c0_g3_i2.p1 TRINITY_DN419_c0_g3~~TRINITY_DN419_c0_g3_i2.p1  ORF type:complete len:195 (+),score=49.50 TRINITY_DN419_c0_g3_i2:106-690(+)